MRLLLEIKPQKYIPFNYINKHSIQGTIYSLLSRTEYGNLHNRSGFKFFTFSDIFPPNDYYPKKSKKLIISSPDREFIKSLYDELTKREIIYIKDKIFKIANIKAFNLNLKFPWVTGSPVVLYLDNKLNMFFTFSRGSKTFFLRRLRENALKKYNIFYKDDFTLNESIFDLFEFNKEVSVLLSNRGRKFIVIGSLWKKIEKKITKYNFKFYKFLMDCGLGEKNSLGFGFVNPIKGDKNESVSR